MRSSISALHQSIEQYIEKLTLNQTKFEFAPEDWAPTPNKALGDFSIPCFKLAKSLSKAPPLIAQELAEQLNSSLSSQPKLSEIREIKAVGPYLNIFQKTETLFARLNKEIQTPAKFGSSELGKDEVIAIDFSSPNVAKEIGLHHLRSTAIGNSISKILAHQGAKVERINYLGDWGTSFGKLILGLKMFGDEKELEKQGLSYMLELYVNFNKAEKEDPGLSDKAKEAFQQLEKGNEDYRRIWKLFRDISIAQFKQLYSRLGIEFDHFDGESLYENAIGPAVDEITNSIGTRMSDGALVCDLEGHDIPILLRKDDGASLYITRDLAAADDRYKRFKLNKSLYVVAIQQKLHFKQLFDLCKALKKPYANDMEHISFGMLAFGSKTMKSREGNSIFLKDALDEGQSRAKALIQEKNPDLENIDQVADQIGIGALIYSDLSQNKNHTINFEWDKALSFEGDTAPFIQYTHARCTSLIERAEAHSKTLDAANKDCKVFEVSQVHNLLLSWDQFDVYAERAYINRDPSQIASAVLDVAKAFNQLYHSTRFLEVERIEDLKVLIDLTKGTKSIIQLGLSLLGIQSPERM
ncbi:arginine--tRNA ligase [bacterium]|nr:arginine--tRNA ligase [bacterium]